MQHSSSHVVESSSLRKGAWTKLEDDLLKDCIQRYGVGKWHLVPQRAGAYFNSFIYNFIVFDIYIYILIQI
jgi:hypothetical protein